MQRRGITLIELLVTLSILALVLMAAVPYFGDLLARRRVEGAIGELGADLQYARSIAVTQGVAVSLASNAEGSGYQISGQVFEGGAQTNRTFKTVQLAPGSALSANVTATFEAQRGLRTPADTDPSFTVSAGGTTATLSIRIDLMGRSRICASGPIEGYPACQP